MGFWGALDAKKDEMTFNICDDVTRDWDVNLNPNAKDARPQARFAFDVCGPLIAGRRYMQRSLSNVTLAAFAALRRSTRTAGLVLLILAGTCPGVRANPTEDFYYHADELGSIAAISDGAAAAAERFEHADFGQPLDPASLAPLAGPPAPLTDNPLLFSGRRLDAESRLFQFRTRMLDPDAGRFTTRDTIGIWGDRASRGNAYAYAAGSPATHADPYGREVRDQPQERLIYFDEWMQKRGTDVPDRRPDDLTEELYGILVALARPYRTFATNLTALRGLRGVTAKNHYVDGRDEPAQFAEHAARRGNCTVSIYVGHGIMGERADRVNDRSLRRVTDALGGDPRGEEGRRPRPRFAFYSCYAGSYNAAVTRKNRFSPAAEWTGTTTGEGIANHFNDNFAAIRRTIEELVKLCGEGGVTLHLYWGSDSERPARPQPER